MERVLKRRPRLKTVIFMWFTALIIVLFLVTSMVLYYQTVPATEEWINDYTLTSVQQSGNKIDNWLKEIEVLSEAAMWNQEIRNLLIETPVEGLSYSERQAINNFLSLLTLPREDIYSIYLVRDSQIVYKRGTYYEPVKTDEILLRFSTEAENDEVYANGGIVFSEPFYKPGPERELVMFAMRKIYDMYDFTEVGSLVIEIRQTQLENIIGTSSTDENNEIYVVAPGGTIIYSSLEGIVGEFLNTKYLDVIRSQTSSKYTRIIDNRWILAGVKSLQSDWQLVKVTPIETVMAPYKRTQQIFLFVSLAGISVVLVLAAVLARSITNPLIRLVQQMTRVRLGNLHEVARSDFPTGNSYELQKLQISFQGMITDLNQMVNEVYEAKLKQKEAELSMLRAQINPHFLYNTLDIIHWKAVIKEENEISELVRSLSNLLRYNIDHSERPVTVSDEMGQVKNYLHIQQARFDGTIRCSTHFESEVLNLFVQKFLLQPIVENCIIHGFSHQKGGVIHIDGRINNNFLILEVSDNGIGISQDKIKSIMTNTNHASESESGNSIGMRNVRRRIKLSYGDSYDLHIVSKLGEGTTVSLLLPIINNS